MSLIKIEYIYVHKIAKNFYLLPHPLYVIFLLKIIYESRFVRISFINETLIFSPSPVIYSINRCYLRGTNEIIVASFGKSRPLVSIINTINLPHSSAVPKFSYSLHTLKCMCEGQRRVSRSYTCSWLLPYLFSFSFFF